MLQTVIDGSGNGKGTCDFCGTKDKVVVSCEYLSPFFEPLFELYAPHHTAEVSLKIDKPYLLHEHLTAYWPNLFNAGVLNDKLIKFLVDQIGKGGEIYTNELFEKPVEFSYIVNELAENAYNLELKWESFADDIKYHNRFFVSEKLDTELLQSIFERLVVTIPAGAEFYRARISETLLPPAEMGKPPLAHATAGRANPVGIPYLYLCNDLRTTLCETRISLHETLTVGKFTSIEPISLVSLRKVDGLGPFEVQGKQFSLEEFIEYRPYLQKLESELSKPVRKQDVHLDYLPTQFLCEFCKSIGFDAVEYKSSMNPDGSNLALFSDRKVSCGEVKFYQVNNLTYNWDELA
ncbi:RES family NAD+ phosphorylase [Mucilaginibacter sp.]|uniref:RES family NAD+ phosphorylase n=1 Tax=Mucilaginibacter sp. TaxID=1882438 RepID=UPI003D1184DA